MAEKLTDQPVITLAELLREFPMWLAKTDEAAGSQDRQVKLGTLEQFIGSGTVGVTQTAHGFSVDDVLSHDGASYVEATADTEANARAVAVVVDVPDADSFLLRSGGFVTGLSGLTGGSWHYLQDAGGLGTTAGTIEVPILLALSATEAWLLPLGFPPSAPVDSVFGRTGTITAAVGDYDASQVDNDSSVAGAQVSDALDQLDSDVKSAAETVDINTQTGTSYTLVSADAGKLVTLENASAITVTVPTNASVAFAVGTTIALQQLGAGTVSVAGDTGVTVDSEGGLTDLSGQYAPASLVKIATDRWLFSGSLA